ncbi:DHBK [Symbiodinium sp. CCMP2456]|nr:DHBK [Symbiodinium sp. CCMP2456]
MATAAVQVQEDDHVQLAPDEVRSYLDDAGFASVYLKGTEYGMPVMFLQAADAEITDQALNTALASMGAVLREKVDIALCYDLRDLRTPSMHNSSTIIKWMNDDEMSPLLSQHALVTCVMVQNSFAGMAVSGCTYVIQKLCSAAKPMAVVYTEEERDNFLREAIKQVKARRAQDATGEIKAVGGQWTAVFRGRPSWIRQLDLSQLQVDLWPHRDPSPHVPLGLTAGSLPHKRFVNHPREVVADALEGYLWTHPNVQLLEGYPEVKVLISSSWSRECGRVAVLSGGGSGHEPADAGMIGDGMLTAVVCGEIFASPSAYAVARALEAITGSAGAIVVVRSNAGTRLNFMSAVKEVQSRLHLRVKVVCVSDDVATSKRYGSRADFTQARGIAGSLLICKIAGAAAAAELSLDEVYEETAAAAAAVRTQGVSFHSCSIPGMLPARPIPADEMEVGLGIHGEPGLRVKATSSTTAKEIVETIMSQLAIHVPRKVPLCVMLNNLGSVPEIEMQLVAGQVMNSELGPRIKLLIGPAHLMTALDTNGISISVLPLEDRDTSTCGTSVALDRKRDDDAGQPADGRRRSKSVHFRDETPETKEAFVQVFSPKHFDGPDVHNECTSHAGQTPAKPSDAFFPQILEEEADQANECSDDIEEECENPELSLRAMRLLAPVACTGWKAAVIPRNPQIVKRHDPRPLLAIRGRSASSRFADSEHPLVRSMLTRACQAVLDSERELNALDAAAADGDLGRNMARAAQLVLGALADGHLPLARPALLFLRLADIMRGVDGTLSALMSVFFGRAGRFLAHRRARWQKKAKAKGRSRKRCLNHMGWNTVDVYDAFCAAEKEVEEVGECAEGKRTFLDALLPALQVAGNTIKRPAEGCEGELLLPLEDDEDDSDWSHSLASWSRQTSNGSGNDVEEEETEALGDEADIPVPWEAIAVAAQEGARATASMKSSPCYGGFINDCSESICDGGAMVVAILLTAMAGPAQGLLQVVEDDRVKDTVQIGETIGHGSFGTVYVAKMASGNSQVAVKISKRSKESGPRSFGDLDFLDRRIVSNWLFMNKPNITHVHQVLVSPTFLYVIMEYLDGPDLSDWMLADEGQRRNELVVMLLLQQILLAAREVHRHGFVHRDLKLDNFRFARGPSSELKLVDVVGTMCFRPDRLISKSWCGTGPFLSPEALLGDVSPAADMWAVGVMAFVLLSGDLPFQASSLSELREAHERALDGDAVFNQISDASKQLVLQLLNPEQAKRLTVDQALELIEADQGCLAQARSRPQPLPLARLQRVRSECWRSCYPDLKPPEVKTLYLVRHGEAVHNIKEKQAQLNAKQQALSDGLTPSSGEFQARVETARKQVLQDETLHDAALSTSGKMQALDALAEIKRLTMQSYPQPTAIYVSPLQRTLQTAAILFPEHPSIHVREELRERRTGLPCDERQRADQVAMRQTFNFMSFDELRSHDRQNFRQCSSAEDGEEDKNELRSRTGLMETLLREQADGCLAVVTHKGYLRELERGRLGVPDAREFDNCEVRVYQVTLPAEGGMLAKRLYIRAR